MMTNTDVKILEMVDDLMREVSEAGSFTSSTLELVGDAIDIKKDIFESIKCKLIVDEMLQANENDGMSNRNGYSGHPPYWMIEQSYGHPDMYNRYSTMTHDGSSRGKYNSYDGNSYDNYSMGRSNNTYGYSRNASEEDMKKRLEELAMNADTSEKRTMYHRFIDELNKH